MQQLVAEAIETGTATIDPDALSSHIRLYRSAAQIGVTETAARSDKLMKKHNALARRLLERQDDYLRSPPTGEYRPTTTAPNATSA